MFTGAVRGTSFRRFLRPSSGAHNCTYSFRYVDSTWSCMYSYVLLMMGLGTVWNM